jgi:hypothetical protein
MLSGFETGPLGFQLVIILITQYQVERVVRCLLHSKNRSDIQVWAVCQLTIQIACGKSCHAVLEMDWK